MNDVDYHAMVAEMFPITRSITGDGVRQTLDLIGQALGGQLQISEVPTGTAIHDWTVPDEWNLRRAYIQGPDGSIVVDTDRSNLHVVSYSVPLDRTMPLAELDDHLHSLPDRPTLIPYRTAYWARTWGFCLADEVRTALPDGAYRVVVDATLSPGAMSYGEVVVPGSLGTASETLLSTHVCHPSLCNDNLSGIAVAIGLVGRFRREPMRHAVRVLFIPGTVGSIAWLARNHDHALRNVRHGLVLTGLGDAAPFTYKRSRAGATSIDKAAEQVLQAHSPANRTVPFSPYGYDERQYCSPGYNLAVGRLGRSTHGEYPEYHTSADNLAFVGNSAMNDAVDVAERILRLADHNERYVSTAPFGEPQLGRRGLFHRVGGQPRPADFDMALLWVLNLADGDADLFDMASRSGLPFALIAEAAASLEATGLLTIAVPA